MVQIVVDANALGRAARVVNALAARAIDMTPLMETFGAILVASTQLRFERGAGPGDVKWTPSTRAQQSGGQTLVDRGHLKQSITYAATGSQVLVGSNLIYARVHQLGADIRPVSAKALHFVIGGKDVFASSVSIPARSFLGIDADDREELGDAAVTYMMEVMA